MSCCCVCGATEWRETLTDEVFEIEGERVLVESIPARICARCGEATFSPETTEAVRRLVHEARPTRAVRMAVYEYAA